MNQAIDVLATASHKQTVAVLKRLGGGTVGMNYAKFSLDELKGWGREKYGADAIASAWEAEQSSPAPVEQPVEVKQAPVEVKPAPVEAAQQLLGIISSLSASAVSEDRVREIVAEAVAAIPREVVEKYIVVPPKGEPVTVDGHVHPALPKVARLAGTGLNVLLVGPAGCGKTHLAGQLAKSLGRDYTAVSCSAGMSESQLGGWLLPIGDGGKFMYVSTEFVRLYESGGLILIDEIDGADSNTLLFINAALANGHFFLPTRHEQPLVKRHAETIILAAANTFGTGPDAIYVGRNQLDAATLDRFYLVRMTYDERFEATLAPKNVVDWVHGIRAKASELKLRRVISTRMIQKAAAALSAGIEWADVQSDLLNGWTREELMKVGM